MWRNQSTVSFTFGVPSTAWAMRLTRDGPFGMRISSPGARQRRVAGVEHLARRRQIGATFSMPSTTSIW